MILNVLRILNADLKALAGGSLLIRLKCFLLSHSFHMVCWYRLGSGLAEVPVVGRVCRPLIEYFIRVFFASDISLKSKIGPGLVIMHGHDIVIGANVVIGERCKIFNGVTLGNKNTEIGFNLQPKIGNDVVLSTGAKVLGDLFVGSGVIVGANSVVLKSVPDNSLAVGVPAVIKSRSV
ncbi:serine O-acetyltransferase [Variovorax boronicumulans]|uniref:serine O-acetyltransferase n=1 Tax=Variovorax boronicumulans TaxID=436515 RepID=UPI002781CC17|nr:hypothetical protein [Variovorax boronicumulans]MDQ0013661.1 serine O-acetyltransferase [Variovorax boronicumulans]